MHIDPSLCLAGAIVGLLVGLTGMGGGALMTPILVLIFHITPIAAISSDLVTSVVMKPVGAAVHLRRRTVQVPLLRWLAIGAVPAAFAGAVIIGKVGKAAHVQSDLKVGIGIVLLVSLAATFGRQAASRRVAVDHDQPLVVHPGRTVLIGLIGGLAVGATSVGAGSLVIALLLLAYPVLRPSQLVGTDIVQAIPLVAAAALGHMLFGQVHLAVTLSLLIGALPAVYIGARFSSQAPASVLRCIIAGVLTGSALALLKAPSPALVAASVAAAAAMALLCRPQRAAAATEPAGPSVPSLPSLPSSLVDSGR